MKRINLDSLIAATNQRHFVIPAIVIPGMWWGHIIGNLATHKDTSLVVWIVALILLAVLIAGIVLRVMFYSRCKLALKKIGLLVQTVNGTRGWMNRTAQRRLREQCEAFEKTYGFYPVEAK